MNKVICKDCGYDLSAIAQHEEERTTCPQCGSTARIHNALIEDKLEIHDGHAFKVKDPAKTGKSKIKAEGYLKYTSSQKARLVKHSCTIDRQNNRYSEEVIDVDNGKVIHSGDEPLKKHIGHGSAKIKKT